MADRTKILVEVPTSESGIVVGELKDRAKPEIYLAKMDDIQEYLRPDRTWKDISQAVKDKFDIGYQLEHMAIFGYPGNPNFRCFDENLVRGFFITPESRSKDFREIDTLVGYYIKLHQSPHTLTVDTYTANNLLKFLKPDYNFVMLRNK